MQSIGNLRTSSRVTSPGSRLRAAASATTGPTDATTGVLRHSERSFLARVKRWLGMDSAGDAAPASLLSRLRPPSTGRFGFFFGRLSRLSQAQFNLAQATHRDLRGVTGAPVPPATALPATALPVPTALSSCLGRVARKKPEDLFDAVCGLWTGAGAPQAAAWQQQAHDFLRAGASPDALLLALRRTLLAAHPGQGTAQADARAQAVYAALVGSVAQHATAPAVAVPDPAVAGAEPLDDLQRRIDALAQTPVSRNNLLARVQALAGIQVGLAAAGVEGAQAGRGGGLHARCLAIQAAQQAEAQQYLGDSVAAFSARRLDEAAAHLDAQRSSLDELRAAMAAFRGWSDTGVRHACEARAASLQDDLDAVAASTGVLAHYESIEEPDPSAAGKPRQPCAPLADFLRAGTVASYRRLQDQVDSLCAMAEPVDQADFLAALGQGILNGQGKVQAALVDDLFAGRPDAVKGILRGAQWDALAGAIRRAAVDRREQSALAQASDDKARAAVVADHRRERFAIEILQRRRELNGEINRLVALKDPTRRFDLLGDSGAMAGACESAIAQIRQVAGDLLPKADVLLVNWIYCSCLDPATLEIDQARVMSLWQCLKGGQSPLPGLEHAQELLQQGFRGFHALRDVHQRIDAFSRLLADAQVLAAASHVHDPRVRAQGLVSELHARLTGQQGIDPGDDAFARLLAQRVEAARQDWKAAGGAAAAKLFDAVARRDALVAKLQGQGWKFDIAPDGHLRSTIDGSSVSQHEQLRRLARCLGIVDHIREEGSRQTADARMRVAEWVAHDFQPLAAQLKHFDPVGRQMRAVPGDAPELGQMLRLVAQKEDIEALLRASDDVARLSVHFSQSQSPSQSPSASLEEVVEAVMRVATLQEAIAQDSPDLRVPARLVGGVLRRLQAYGLVLSDPIPAVARLMRDLEPQLARQPMDMAALCKRLDPVSPLAAGVVQPRIPGAPTFSPGAQGLLERAKAYVKAGEERRRLDNQHAVAQRFAGLEAGQSFEIQLGRTGEVSIGSPVAPGVTAAVGISVSSGSAIRISRTGDTAYDVDVVQSRSGTLSATLSVLAGIVTGTGQRSADAGQGYRVSCDSREDALDLVEALVGLRRLDAGRWTAGRVQALQSAGGQTRAALQAKAEVPTPQGAALLTLEAALGKSAGWSLELAESPFLRVERRTRSRAWHAKVTGDVLDGRVTGEAERGAAVSETLTQARRGALLRAAPVRSLQSRVVGGQARACLLRLMPQLSAEAMAHYEAQVEQAHAEAEEAGQVLEVVLESVMTPQGVRRANHFYRQAGLLQGAGTEGGLAGPQAREALEEAERELREPANYAVREVAVVLKSESQATASQAHPLKETARVQGERRRALAPFAGQSWKLLP